jgi:hypothetical protein
VIDRADELSLEVDLIERELTLLATELVGHDVAGRWRRLRAAG